MLGRWARRGAIAALLVGIVVVAACRPGGEVKVDAAANGSQVELKPGQVLVVALESNITTGYSWAVAEPAAAVLEQVGEAEYKAAQPQTTPLVGSGGTETFRFRAARAGQASLKLIYRRPFEKGVEPIKTFTLAVTAQ